MRSGDAQRMILLGTRHALHRPLDRGHEPAARQGAVDGDGERGVAVAKGHVAAFLPPQAVFLGAPQNASGSEKYGLADDTGSKSFTFSESSESEIR